MSDSKEAEQAKRSDQEQLHRLVKEAAQDVPQAVLALREFLRQHPNVWQDVGDLATLALEQHLRLIAGNDVLLRESLLLQLEAFKRQLAESPGSPLETILIDRIGVCWLQANMADLLVVQNSQANQGQCEFLQRRAERAQTNLLAAVKDLCTVRKLLREAQARPLRQPRVSAKAPAEPVQPAAEQAAICDPSGQAVAGVGTD